jgi:hypothetical protein
VPSDIKAIEADRRVRLRVLQTIEGFDVEKFASRTVRLAVIEPVDRPHIARGGDSSATR